MSSCTTVKLTKEQIVEMCDNTINYYRNERDETKKNYVTELTKKKRWFGLKQPYTTEEATEIMTRWNYNRLTMYIDYMPEGYYRAIKLKELATDGKITEVWLSSEDYNFLNSVRFTKVWEENYIDSQK